MFSFPHSLPDRFLKSSVSFQQSLDFLISPASRSNFHLLYRFKYYLISFFYPLQNRIFIFCIVLTITCFHSFTRFQIEFSSSVPFQRSLDFIFSPASWSNFSLPYRLNDYFISLFHSLSGRILICCIVLRMIWFYIEFLPYASFQQSFDFILLSIPKSNFNLLYCFSDHLISFFHSLPYPIIPFASFKRSFNVILSPASRWNFYLLHRFNY